MTIELTSDQLVDLVCGTKPFNYELTKALQDTGLGTYVGGMVDEWKWDVLALRKLDEDDLKYVYDLVKSAEK